MDRQFADPMWYVGYFDGRVVFDVRHWFSSVGKRLEHRLGAIAKLLGSSFTGSIGGLVPSFEPCVAALQVNAFAFQQDVWAGAFGLALFEGQGAFAPA
jgi:hypothetical protein